MMLDVAPRGSEALENTHTVLPHLIGWISCCLILTYEVCRSLRQTRTATSGDFLTQKDERSDKLQGLELRATITLPSHLI